MAASRPLPADFAPRRILVRAPSPVGDLAMSTASLADIRRAHPRARITLLVRGGRDGLVEGAGWFDDLLIDDSVSGPRRLLALAARLRRRRYDLAILFTNSLRGALLTFLARIPVRVGLRKGGQSVLLTHPVEPVRDGRRWKPLPMHDIYARLCEGAGVARSPFLPRLAVSEATEATAASRRAELGIEEGEELIGLVPGAAFGGSKVWPLSRMAEAADRLTRRYGRRTIIFGGPGEESMAAELTERMETRPIQVVDPPLGLALLKPFLRDLAVLVAMDSGPRHVAVAFDVPTVVVIGPTDPVWSAVDLSRSEVLRRDLDCSPCQRPTCPLGHHECMRTIGVQDVVDAVDRLDRRFGLFGERRRP